MISTIRKFVTAVEETRLEMGQVVSPASRRVMSAAIIENPFAGRFAADLEALMTIGAELGELLTRRGVEALEVDPAAIQSFGKAAAVGENGELEHAAAILHPRLGAPMRDVLGGGKALVPSSKKMSAPGQSIDVPLGHKNAAYVRSHFDAMELSCPDAPQPNEIVVAIALATGGRPLPRIGGLTHETAQGDDGLR
ncbi:amino acid synthesis family protein [Roseibium algae]|uniref:Amino acid synthesis family protein n=1 Tax=Roseibium algae TaxID=3123038 RepID=A0ABU8TNB9_9HYPH